MTAAVSIAAEAAVLDVLSDADGDVDVSEALTVLVHVVAGLCCVSDQPSEERVSEFVENLGKLIAQDAGTRTIQ